MELNSCHLQILSAGKGSANYASSPERWDKPATGQGPSQNGSPTLRMWTPLALGWWLARVKVSSLLLCKDHLKPVPKYSPVPHNVDVASVCGPEMQSTYNLYLQIYPRFPSLRFPPASVLWKLLSTIKIITILSSFGAYTSGKLTVFMYSAASYSPQSCLLFVLVYTNIIADPLLLNPARNESSKVPCQSETGQTWKTSWKPAKTNVVVDCFSKSLAEGPPEKVWQECNALWLLPECTSHLECSVI